MPGYELIGKQENKELSNIFNKSNGVLFGHAFDELRNNIFRVRDFESKILCRNYFRYNGSIRSYESFGDKRK